MGMILEFIGSNWEYMTILLLAVDKAVAMSPSKMDDLLWFSMKKILNFIADLLFHIVFFTMCGLVLLCILILWVFDRILGKWKTSI